jgi:hypothetical protein|tara:strand:- start:211 stop:783 length:573 start_codon:yes stop_codon:yes gene_type:complete
MGSGLLLAACFFGTFILTFSGITVAKKLKSVNVLHGDAPSSGRRVDSETGHGNGNGEVGAFSFESSGDNDDGGRGGWRGRSRCGGKRSGASARRSAEEANSNGDNFSFDNLQLSDEEEDGEDRGLLSRTGGRFDSESGAERTPRESASPLGSTPGRAQQQRGGANDEEEEDEEASFLGRTSTERSVGRKR